MSSLKISILYVLFMVAFVTAISGHLAWTLASVAALLYIVIKHYYGDRQ
jgi:hypothetical protein